VCVAVSGRAFYSHAVPRIREARTATLGFLLLALAADARAAKTDVVVLRNGDRITCEVKVLQRGQLQVSTDDMGTLGIEWNKVQSVTARGLFEVEDLRGRLFLGSLSPGPDPGQLDVVGLAGTSTLDLLFVVRIQQLKATFWKRLSGSLDAGFSYTSSSALTQFNLDGQLTFRRPTFQVQANASSILTQQPGVDDTQRANASLGYVRFRGRRQVLFGTFAAERNRELGFDLRAAVQGGWGKFLVRGQGDELLGVVGLSVNREIPVEGDKTTNLEAMIGFNWAKYAYSSPKTDIEIRALVFPSLTTWGRWRLEANASVKRELFNDFYVTLKGYDSYDSQPATEGAVTNDWGVTAGLGYSFP
jgi:hypothetical protein